MQAEGEATPTPGVTILTGCLQQSRERYQLVAGLTGFQGGGGRGGKDCPLELPGGGGGLGERGKNLKRNFTQKVNSNTSSLVCIK